MSFLCPSCCLRFFTGKKSPSQNRFAEPEHAEQLDEEDEEYTVERINSHAQELPQEYFHEQNGPSKSSKEQEMDVNLNIEQSSSDEDQPTEEQSASKSTSSSGHKKFHSQSSSDENSDPETTEPQRPTESQLQPNYSKFSLNLQPYQKYYELIYAKTLNIERYFQSGKKVDLPETKCNLQIDKIDTGKFLVCLQLPCSYSFYTQLMKDSKSAANKKYMALFEKVAVLEAFKPNLTKNLVQMKKFSMLEPRQFVYLKFSNGSFRENWEVCISDFDGKEDFVMESSECKRCDIFSVSNFKEIGPTLFIRQYCEIDLKSPNISNAMWGKLVHEGKQYYENLYLYTEKNYQNELI